MSGHFFLHFSLLFPTLAVVYLKAFAVSVVGVCLFPAPFLNHLYMLEYGKIINANRDADLEKKKNTRGL